MSDKFDPDAFKMEGDRYTGECQPYYNGIMVPKCDKARGSRQFFNINNEFFIKACSYAQSQTQNEVFAWARIEKPDKKYFIELLYACDFKDRWHWSVWRYVDLVAYFQDEGSYLYQRCNDRVRYLCDKYNIDDVYGCAMNWNWFIHEGEPLIVDLGCAF